MRADLLLPLPLLLNYLNLSSFSYQVLHLYTLYVLHHCLHMLFSNAQFPDGCL